MAAAAGKNVSPVFQSALLLGGCLEGVSVRWLWLAVEWEVNTLMLASLCLLLSGACLLPYPAVEGAGTVHGCGLGEGWQWSDSLCNPWHWGSREGLDSGVLGLFMGAGMSWMCSMLLFISCPNTTGSLVVISPDTRGGVQAGGSRIKFPVSSPISHGWKLQTRLEKKWPESRGVLGIRSGHPMVSLGQAPSCSGKREQDLCSGGTGLIWPVLGSCNK